jgi:hypothetical protein
MFFIVIGAISISISEVFSPEQTTSPVVDGINFERKPLWLAVLVSFTTPCTFMLNLFLVFKPVNETLKIDGIDFTCAYFGVSCFVYQVLGVVHFLQNENSFNWSLWVMGSTAGLLYCLGCIFSIFAYCTMAPSGQVAALIGT